MFNEKFKLNEEFYLRDTEIVARDLIGKIFVKRIQKKSNEFNKFYNSPKNINVKSTINEDYIAAKIVETEAYLHKTDAASHSYPGMTKRNQPMFARGGVLYVYKSYGIHHCVNIVTEAEGIGAAVLIRAAEPIAGIGLMMKNRETNLVYNLCSGPGNFGRAFGIGLEHNNESLLGDNIFVVNQLNDEKFEIGNSSRIGITKSKDLLLRFFVMDSKYIRIKK